jgi:hypothetical protein
MPARSGLALGSALLLTASTVWARVESTPVERLEVLLTTARTLSDTARTSMLEEATAIWQRQGLAIDWLPPTTVLPVSRNRLRVLVVERRQPMADSGDCYAVGELVRPDGTHPVAFVSIDNATRLIASVRGNRVHDLIAFDDRRLGVVLGRILAHEIGHHVLNTATHARTGLMRPHFSPYEFIDLRPGAFVLDHAAAAWLRTERVDPFAYVR